MLLCFIYLIVNMVKVKMYFFVVIVLQKYRKNYDKYILTKLHITNLFEFTIFCVA